MKFTRHEIINLLNVHTNIPKDVDNIFTSRFKIRLIKNILSLQNEVEQIKEVITDKIENIINERKLLCDKLCKKDKKGVLMPCKDSKTGAIYQTILFNCLSFPDYQLKKNNTKKMFTECFNKIFETDKNKKIIEDINTMLNEEIEINLYKYPELSCPCNLSIDFYVSLEKLIAIDE
jgi:hypothetical protein